LFHPSFSGILSQPTTAFLSPELPQARKPRPNSQPALEAMPPIIDWREEYAASLKDVELNNPVNMDLVQTCPS
jgi:hypothetical protein